MRMDWPGRQPWLRLFDTRKRLEGVVGLWERATDFSYVVAGEDEEILGVMSLMARIGPRAFEIGYWLRSDRTGRGVATACARVLTEAALALPGIDKVEIHYDEPNIRSAVAHRLGYRLDRIEDDEITVPAEVGRTMIWVLSQSVAHTDSAT
jgi:RimJ/RimL family protein N-acetyltransferase